LRRNQVDLRCFEGVIAGKPCSHKARHVSRQASLAARNSLDLL
jgi:hypothetical protein